MQGKKCLEFNFVYRFNFSAHLIIFNIFWNPKRYVDKQKMKHSIFNTKPVEIYRLFFEEEVLVLFYSKTTFWILIYFFFFFIYLLKHFLCKLLARIDCCIIFEELVFKFKFLSFSFCCCCCCCFLIFFNSKTAV